MTFSTTTTELSTTMPKSMAPRLSSVPAMPKREHAAEGEQHRQRNGRRHDQAGPQVAQEDEQDASTTSRPPSNRLLRTVSMTWSTSSVRS